MPGDTATPTFKDFTSVYHIDTLVNRNKPRSEPSYAQGSNVAIRSPVDPGAEILIYGFH